MVIGITGSFGSGKTIVAKMFSRLGAYVIDADKIYHSMVLPRGKVYKKIVRHFGRSILKRDRTIDREKLGAIVFKKRSRLKFLNSLVHPELISRINKIIGAKKGKIDVVDAALLVETNFYKNLDRLIVVRSSDDRQINRQIRAKGLTRKEILEKIRMQAPLKKKLALADFIIDNSGSRKQTLIQVQKIWKQLRGEKW